MPVVARGLVNALRKLYLVRFCIYRHHMQLAAFSVGIFADAGVADRDEFKFKVPVVHSGLLDGQNVKEKYGKKKVRHSH